MFWAVLLTFFKFACLPNYSVVPKAFCCSSMSNGDTAEKLCIPILLLHESLQAGAYTVVWKMVSDSDVAAWLYCKYDLAILATIALDFTFFIVRLIQRLHLATEGKFHFFWYFCVWFVFFRTCFYASSLLYIVQGCHLSRFIYHLTTYSIGAPLPTLEAITSKLYSRLTLALLLEHLFWSLFASCSILLVARVMHVAVRPQHH